VSRARLKVDKYFVPKYVIAEINSNERGNGVRVMREPERQRTKRQEHESRTRSPFTAKNFAEIKQEAKNDMRPPHGNNQNLMAHCAPQHSGAGQRHNCKREGK